MIDVALKEWKVVCDLLQEGHLTFLLRKGGVIEDAGPGCFELLHRRFALYPSWAHQKPKMIKTHLRDRVEVMGDPASVTMHGIAEAVKIWQVPSRATIAPLDDLHPWTPSQIDMRFNYRSENPLYLVVLRVYRLARPKTIHVGVAYGGCRSWVPLTAADAADESGATPVLDDRDFDTTFQRLQNALR